MFGFRHSAFLLAACAGKAALVSPLATLNLDLTFRLGQRGRKPTRQARRGRRLNRSQHWVPADSYQRARQISPVPYCFNPVR